MKIPLALLTIALAACVEFPLPGPELGGSPGSDGSVHAPPDTAAPDARAPSADVGAPPRRRIVAIWGQSNAVGRASWTDVTTLSDADTPLSDVPLAQQIADAANPIPWSDIATGPLAPRTGNPTQNMGLELSLGRALDQRTRDGYALVKFAVGSASLQYNFRVDASYPTLPVDGPNLFTQMVTYTAAQCAALDGDLVAIDWTQGEDDATAPNFAAAYAGNLETLIARTRDVFPGVPFIVTALSPLSVAPYADDIRAAENTVARDVAGVTIVDASGLPLQLNQPHYTADGYVALGDRVAAVTP